MLRRTNKHLPQKSLPARNNQRMARTAEVQKDHVDRFLESIKDELPHLDLAVEGIVDRISGLSRRIKRMMEETLTERSLSGRTQNGRRRPTGTDRAGIDRAGADRVGVEPGRTGQAITGWQGCPLPTANPRGAGREPRTRGIACGPRAS